MLVVINYGRESNLRPEQDRAMGGIQTAALWLASALAQLGHETHIFGRCKNPGHSNGVTLHDRSEFAEFTARRDIDVLVAIPEVLPLLMPLRARAGVVWTGNAYQMGDCALEIPWAWAKDIGCRGERARLYSMAVLHPYADLVVVYSQWQAQHIRDTSGVPSSKLKVASL